MDLNISLLRGQRKSMCDIASDLIVNGCSDYGRQDICSHKCSYAKKLDDAVKRGNLEEMAKLKEWGLV